MVAAATIADLLRLLVVPAFAWGAYRDVRTRRLPNRLWPPLVAIGVVALAIDAAAQFPFAGVEGRLFLVRVGFSLGFLLPFSYLTFRLGAFGGADAKALMTLAVVFPTTPTYTVPFAPMAVLPVEPGALGVTAMAALTNAVLVAAGYVVVLGLVNAAAGRVELASFLGRPMAVERLPAAHGTLLDREGLPSSGLDLDALRMYLRWRGLSLADLRADPDRLRSPDSVGETFDPTDGAVGAGPRADGGNASGRPASGDEASGGQPAGEAAVTSDDRQTSEQPPVGQDGDATGDAEASVGSEGDSEVTDTHDDWAAEQFLESIEGTAYGTTPAELREGIERVTTAETVWVSPGLPFVVPLFGGLVVAVTVGDVLTVLLRALGLL